MNWFKALNDALDYMEAHMTSVIDYDQLAQIAMCNRFQFMRTFALITNMNLSDYIRQRRLTLAANDLVTTQDKIIHIAYKYQYETPESFSKAFKKFHDTTPSSIRKKGQYLKAVPPLSFQITIKGERRMNYRIEKKAAFKVSGYVKQVSTKDGENYKTIPAFWQELMENGSYNKLVDGQTQSYGICYDHDENLESFKYIIAVDGEKTEDVVEIPASTWAVFESIGPMPEAIQRVWQGIYKEWFPATQYKHAGTAELEVYLAGDPSSEDYKCEVWIPIQD